MAINSQDPQCCSEIRVPALENGLAAYIPQQPAAQMETSNVSDSGKHSHATPIVPPAAYWESAQGSGAPVTHSSEPQVSDGDKKLTKMDVSVLEEQYDHIKQKQKLQPYIIVYKTGGHESVLPESMVNPVLINKKVKRSKSYRGDVPGRKVTLEATNSGDSEDDLLWRIHLGTRRLGQGDSWDLSHCNHTPWSFDNQRLISKGNDTLQTKESGGASELSELRQLGSSSVLSSLREENGCNTSSSCQKPPVKPATAALWAHQQISATKSMPACNKLNFYPFPNRKGPRISEAARRLGLYGSQ